MIDVRCSGRALDPRRSPRVDVLSDLPKTRMETIQAYLERKHRELRLLNDCLTKPLDLAPPRSVDEVVGSKFQITAALRAEHELQAWKATETASSHAADPVSGPFEFRYDYQRADFTVRGPSFYEFDGGCISAAVYTASGMAAISAVLLASAQIVEKADLLVLPGSYGETLELIRGLVPHLRLVALSLPLGDAFVSANSPKILLLDSCSLAGAFEAAVEATARVSISCCSIRHASRAARAGSGVS